jgi:FG-GAP-like repeat
MRCAQNDNPSRSGRRHRKSRIAGMLLVGVVLATAVAFAAPTLPDASFAPAVNYAVGNNPHSVVAADFNGDHKLDMAVANGGDNTVSVLLGQGDGSFGPATAFSVGVEPYAVATGDFDKDGNLDLAVVN